MHPITLRAFMRSLLSSWFTGMSGPLSVPLSIAAVFVSSGIAKIGLGLTAFVCFWGAAYGVWVRERTSRNAAEENLAQLRQHQLEISFGGFGIALDKDSPLRQVVDVIITNKTDRRLEDCRLQLAIITHDGIERPAWARFPFCEPFSLLVDESKRRRVVEYNFDELSPNLLVPLFDEIDNKWVRREGGLLLTPGEYELCIEGFSSHTPMAHFTLRAKCENERWAIGPDVVSLNSAGDSDTSKPSPLMPAGRAPNLHQRLVRLAKNALYYVKPGN
jgi:hypothetical protein